MRCIVTETWRRFCRDWPLITKAQSVYAFQEVEHVHKWKAFDDIEKYGAELVLCGRWCAGCGMIQKHEGPMFGWCTVDTQKIELPNV